MLKIGDLRVIAQLLSQSTAKSFQIKSVHGLLDHRINLEWNC